VTPTPNPLAALVEAAERVATIADSLYHIPDQGRKESDKRAIAALLNARAALGASGKEGGES
jgi:hypothetical protein